MGRRMTVEQVGAATPKPYVPCVRCEGYGVALGPIIEATGKRDMLPCKDCEGAGIKVRQSGGQLRRLVLA